MRHKDRIIRIFYTILGGLLVLLGIVSLAVPILPGLVMMAIGVGIISPRLRERMLATGHRLVDRIPAFHRFHRRQTIRWFLLIIAGLLLGIAITIILLTQG